MRRRNIFCTSSAPASGRAFLLLVAAWLLVLIAVPPAQARDAIVRSFDGTPIVTHFFPAPGLEKGERAPTIMIGHGWGGSGATSPPEDYARAGYNILTWDARGFGGSGGTVMIDHPAFEARDAQALISFIARQPEALLDRRGDPRVGMDGPSYGGGIQFITAARDRRVDVITPTIAWHSMNRALYRARVVKSGWDLALVGVGIPTSTLLGIFSPAGIQTGNQSPFFYDAVLDGVSTGQLSPEFQAWLSQHGPDYLLDRVRVPTMLVQGTVDTLFTLDEAHDNYMALRRNGVPIRMMFYCGGHGVCRTGSDTGSSVIATGGGLVDRRKLAWFARWLKRNESVRTGPRFEWIDEAGGWNSSGRYPLPRTGTLSASGAGTLPLAPGETPGSGILLFATPSQPAVEVPIPAEAGRNVVGTPRLNLTYTATGTSTRPDGETAIFAQVVDNERGVVVNNLATPIPILLDGQEHTIDIALERIASRTTAAGYTLQLIPQTSVYDLQRATGVVDVAQARIQIPLVKSGPRRAPCRRIRGTRRSDRLRGTARRDCLFGGRGRDRLAGLGGNDLLRGGPGRDVLRGGRGRDVIRASNRSSDRVNCGPGRDVAYVNPRQDVWRKCERVLRRRGSGRPR